LENEEIINFQNEYSLISQYSKNYLKLINEKIDKEKNNFFIEVDAIKEKIEFFKEKRNLFINKKINLEKEIK
jgi:hypothetical protein